MCERRSSDAMISENSGRKQNENSYTEREERETEREGSIYHSRDVVFCNKTGNDNKKS